MPAPFLTGNPSLDGPALMQWMMEVDARLQLLDNDGSGYAPLAPLRGALVTKAATQTNVNLTAGSPTFGGFITFDTVTYDTSGVFNIANNTRLTVPAGVSKARLACGVALDNVLSGSWVYLSIDRYNASNVAINNPGVAQQNGQVSNTAVRMGAVGGVSNVNPGEYFLLRVYTTDAAVDVGPGNTWFAMEILA